MFVDHEGECINVRVVCISPEPGTAFDRLVGAAVGALRDGVDGELCVVRDGACIGVDFFIQEEGITYQIHPHIYAWSDLEFHDAPGLAGRLKHADALICLGEAGPLPEQLRAAMNVVGLEHVPVVFGGATKIDLRTAAIDVIRTPSLRQALQQAALDR